jgi:CheY-like chemotaxis protein
VRILIVEDEPDARRALELIIREAGADVATAASSDDALESIKAKPVHILVTDLSMPGKDGFVLLRQLRDLEVARAAPPVPAVALTALASPEERSQCRAAGFDEHIAKPVDPQRLLSILRRLVDR